MRCCKQLLDVPTDGRLPYRSEATRQQLMVERPSILCVEVIHDIEVVGFEHNDPE